MYKSQSRNQKAKPFQPHRVNLHILSPIHIGTGQELDPFSFVIKDETLFFIDLMKWMHRRAKRLLWFNPEHRRQWGTGDSDMLEYAPICDSVYQVRNLAQLSSAVDELLTGS